MLCLYLNNCYSSRAFGVLEQSGLFVWWGSGSFLVCLMADNRVYNLAILCSIANFSRWHDTRGLKFRH